MTIAQESTRTNESKFIAPSLQLAMRPRALQFLELALFISKTDCRGRGSSPTLALYLSVTKLPANVRSLVVHRLGMLGVTVIIVYLL